jgi:hypothetical protein
LVGTGVELGSEVGAEVGRTAEVGGSGAALFKLHAGVAITSTANIKDNLFEIPSFIALSFYYLTSLQLTKAIVAL